MPWHIESNCKGCPVNKPFGVVRGHKGTHGHVEGCHPTQQEANQQLKALYAAEDDMNVPEKTAKSKTKTLAKSRGAECLRSFDFENTMSGDGRTMEGYAAVFNSTSRIADWGGDFDEVILPGAFKRSLEKRTPVLQFDHGKDPRVGSVPIGAIDAIHEDERGLYVRARLFDNPVVDPVRQAIEGRAINGMSFRFSIPEGGDKWIARDNDVELREITDTDTRELGPVVFPAYDSTSVSVRSLIAQLDPNERRALVRELAEEVRDFLEFDDLKDLAVDLGPGGPRDGENDAQPRSGEASTDPFSARIAQLALRELAIRHSSAYMRENNV